MSFQIISSLTSIIEKITTTYNINHHINNYNDNYNNELKYILLTRANLYIKVIKMNDIYIDDDDDYYY